MMRKVQFVLFLSVMVRVAWTAPETWVQSVSYNDETITMRLTMQDLRGSFFEFWVQNATGGYDKNLTIVDERSYIGTVDEYPGAVASGILKDDGIFWGAVYFDRGATWWTLDDSVTGTRGYDVAPQFTFPAYTVAAGHAGTITYGYDVAVDASYTYYNGIHAENLAETLEGIEYTVAITRALYMHNAMLRPYLARVIIRTDAAQNPYLSGENLADVKAEWTTNHTDANRDLVALIRGQGGGGVAFINVVGNTVNGNSVNDSKEDGNFTPVWRHEMGHNWGLGHQDGGGPEGSTINSHGNKYARFSGPELEKALTQRDAKLLYLNHQGTYTALNLPPYAGVDAATFTQLVDQQVSINVLSNDHDINGDTLSLVAFDAVSLRGGSVVQQGQNLLYTPNSSFIGTDSFMYTIQDPGGLQATGVAVVHVDSGDPLKLHLPLNESTGTVVRDVSSFANPCSAQNGTVLGVGGRFGNAVSFDGIDDLIAVNNVNLHSSKVTITAWIKRPSTPQKAWAGLVFNKVQDNAGLNFGENNELRYHWNGGNWGWNSGLVPPADQWVFTALVVEPSKAILYMHNGTSLQSAINLSAHYPVSFSGETEIGRGAGQDDRCFTGLIDEVRIYDKALTQAEILNLVAGGEVEAPSPFDGATDVISPTLRWGELPIAVEYDIYIGTNQTSVANATRSSAAYKATSIDALFIATLLHSDTYYWRIDAVTESTVLPGKVWSFTTGSLVPPPYSVLVNFEQNSNQSFTDGQPIGPTSVNSANWNSVPGASGSFNNLVDNFGTATDTDIQWNSSSLYFNHDGTSDDEHRLSVGYLYDGNTGGGKGVTLTLSNIPYSAYRVYGLFANRENDSGSCGIVNFNVNGTWALGGSAETTTQAWGSIGANYIANGEYWTQIDPGVIQGNYWMVETTGSTCTIIGEDLNGINRGGLTAVIIEAINLDTDGDGDFDITDPDDDGDLIPDEWEIARGLNPLLDEGGHSDSDPYDNWYEYMTDTDPLDANSYQILLLESDTESGEAWIRYSTSSNRVYYIQYRDNLMIGSWSDVAGPISGTGAELTGPRSVIGTKPGYYRIRINLP